MLALLTAIGPVRRSTSRASSWSGTRSAMVPSVSPEVHPQARLDLADDGQRAGPVPLDQLARRLAARRWPAPGSGARRRSAPAAACPGRGPWRPAVAARPRRRTRRRRSRRRCRSAARCTRRARWPPGGLGGLADHGRVVVGAVEALVARVLVRRARARLPPAPDLVLSAVLLAHSAHPASNSRSRSSGERAGRHRSRVRRTAVTNRGRPVRSRWSRTALNAPVAKTTAGADSPCTSACSKQSSPPVAAAGRRPGSAPGSRPGRRRRRTAPRSGRGRAPRGRPRRTPPAGCRAGWRSPGRPCRLSRAGRRPCRRRAARRGCRPGCGGVRGRLGRTLDRVRRRPAVQLVGDRLGDRARAGAQLHHPRRRRRSAISGRSRSIAQPGHHLGLRPRHEHARVRPRARRGGSRPGRSGAAAGSRASPPLDQPRSARRSVVVDLVQQRQPGELDRRRRGPAAAGRPPRATRPRPRSGSRVARRPDRKTAPTARTARSRLGCRRPGPAARAVSASCSAVDHRAAGRR